MLRTAGTVVLVVFLIGGALCGYISMMTLHSEVATSKDALGRPTSVSRVNFLDLLLGDVVRRSQKPSPEATKTP